MYQQGYALIGYSSFNGVFDAVGALAHARNVGAERVIQYTARTGTVQGSIPFTTSQAVTTYHSGSASAYGSGGYASGSYSGASTTYVPTTTYVPYAIDRFDQFALYFAPLGPPCLGILQREATDAEKRFVGLNEIFVVEAVRNNSPAFDANVLPGDIVVSAEGIRVRDLGVSGEPGQRVVIGLARKGEAGQEVRNISVEVTLGLGCAA